MWIVENLKTSSLIEFKSVNRFNLVLSNIFTSLLLLRHLSHISLYNNWYSFEDVLRMFRMSTGINYLLYEIKYYLFQRYFQLGYDAQTLVSTFRKAILLTYKTLITMHLSCTHLQYWVIWVIEMCTCVVWEMW